MDRSYRQPELLEHFRNRIKTQAWTGRNFDLAVFWYGGAPIKLNFKIAEKSFEYWRSTMCCRQMDSRDLTRPEQSTMRDKLDPVRFAQRRDLQYLC